MPAVSVIVPIYKVERYIEKCARSLFEQTLEDMEFIFVNDCTPDASMAVLRSVIGEYPLRAPFVKIIEKDRNEGLPAARRTGLDYATGEYVIHCDSDDWVEPDMYGILYSKAVEGDCDMVLCRLSEVDENGHASAAREVDNFTVDDVLGALIGMDIHAYLLNKLVKRSAYVGVRFPVCNMWEDVPTIIQLASKCKSFGFVEEPLYHYVRHPQSMSGQLPSVEKIEQMRKNVEFVAEFLKEEKLLDGYTDELRHLRRMVKVYAQRLPLSYYKSLYPEENLDLLLDKRITLAEKMGHITTMVGIHGLSDKFKKK